MKSFPSTLNRGNNGISLNHSSKSLLDRIVSNFKSSFKNAFKAGWGAIRYGAKATGEPVDLSGLYFDVEADIRNLIKNTDTTKLNKNYPWTFNIQPSEISPNVPVENQYNFDSTAIGIINQYRNDTFDAVIRNNIKSGETPTGPLFAGGKIPVKHSLFNPYNAVHHMGMLENVPLMEDQEWDDIASKAESLDLSNCTIKKLVYLSTLNNSVLGQARYKYADFAFCKDLGLPNNRLITLRRFAHPIGDNIFTDAQHTTMDIPGDIGRMLCYFDTEDNKLEDILKYSFSSEWKEMEASIEQLSSQENNHETPLGKVINFLNPSFNKNIAQGMTDAKNTMFSITGDLGFKTDAYYDPITLTNYDKHKIYNNVNTIRTTHKYEGKLDFKHEFTLTFSYKLRGYQNINTKSAMLDLIGNILAVTYNRGNFWGGRSDIIGANPNKQGWKMAEDLFNRVESGAGNLFSQIVNGTADLSDLLGSGANIVGKFANMAGDSIKAMAADPQGTVSSFVQKISKLNGQFGWGAALKGMLKGKLGRPEIYAFQSLLTAENVGLWHVTIGNPLNPIASFGNLIITNTEFKQLGPLGLDDFPTEIKVSVTLKHAMPRDSAGIERMYTKGKSSIYWSLAGQYAKNGQDSNTINLPKDTYAKLGFAEYVGDYRPERVQANCKELV